MRLFTGEGTSEEQEEACRSSEKRSQVIGAAPKQGIVNAAARLVEEIYSA